MTFALTIAQPTLSTVAEAYKHEKAKGFVLTTNQMINRNLDEMEKFDRKNPEDHNKMTCKESKRLLEKNVVPLIRRFVTYLDRCTEILSSTYDKEKFWHDYVKTPGGVTIITVVAVIMFFAVYCIVGYVREPRGKAASCPPRHAYVESHSAEVDDNDDVVEFQKQGIEVCLQNGPSSLSQGSIYTFTEAPTKDFIRVTLDTVKAYIHAVNEALVADQKQKLRKKLKQKKVNVDPEKLKRTEHAMQASNCSRLCNLLFPSPVRRLGSINYDNLKYTTIILLVLIMAGIVCLYILYPKEWASWQTLSDINKNFWPFLKGQVYDMAQKLSKEKETDRSDFHKNFDPNAFQNVNFEDLNA